MSAILVMAQCVDPSVAETGIFQNFIKATAADAFAAINKPEQPQL